MTTAAARRDDARRAARRAAVKQHHPDVGGSAGDLTRALDAVDRRFAAPLAPRTRPSRLRRLLPRRRRYVQL